jgi:hypothetical protein
MNNLVYIWHAINLLKHDVSLHIRQSGQKATCEKHIKYLSNGLLTQHIQEDLGRGLSRKPCKAGYQRA